MFKPINKMFEPMIRMAAAVLVAGGIAFAVTAAPAANDGAAKPTQSQPFAKADRLHVPVTGPACSKHGWPNVEPKCQFDLREPAGVARTVRVIALR
jgi:hypothetical protein